MKVGVVVIVVTLVTFNPTLMCSNQWVDSILDSQWESSIRGKQKSLSLRRLSRITCMLCMSRNSRAQLE